MIKNFVDLSEEKEIINLGHTLSLIEWKGELYAYKGSVKFDKIELLKGRDIYSLEPQGIILKNRRWAVGIVINDEIHLYCTYHKGYKRDIFKYQNIYYYRSEDGLNFVEQSVVVDGSAPWICEFDNLYYLYYHRKTDVSHDILVKYDSNIQKIGSAKENIVMSISVEKETLSAPSIIHFNNRFWMTCEYRVSRGSWKTMIYVSQDPIKEYKLEGVLLDRQRACAFQYVFGNQYLVTYSSRRGDGNWGICVQEGLL